MLTKAELLALLVSLSRMSDIDRIDDDACLPEDVCATEERAAVRSAGRLIHELRRSFRYVDSPRFLAEVEGKSASLRAFRSRAEDEAIKRRRHLASFDEALVEILRSRQVYELVPESARERVDALVEVVQGLANPT